MKRLLKTIGGLGLTFFWAGLAYADNCGSLSDCFYTVGSATAAAVGVAVTVIVGLLLDVVGLDGEPAPQVFSAEDPAADALVQDPKVRAAIEGAFTQSHDHQLPDADVREQGGWIVRLPSGELDVVRWPEGESGSMQPPSMPANAVGHFHTHPYGNDVTLIHRPSTADSLFTQARGVPGFVIDRQSIMRIDSEHPGAFRDIVLR